MRKREIKLPLPDEFLALCEAGETTPEELIKTFIGDLCGFTSWRRDGFHSNGAETRAAAKHYYETLRG